MIIVTCTMWCWDSTSDKIYKAFLKKEPLTNNWKVDFGYGRRNQTLKTGTKTESPLSFVKATEVFNKLIASKVKKGYEVQRPTHFEAEKIIAFQDCLSALLNGNHISGKDYQSLYGMLGSNDPETSQLAQTIIITKDKEHGSRINL
jgi:predicted DNA-binding WGR domain protein